jgi:ribosome-binding ATPase
MQDLRRNSYFMGRINFTGCFMEIGIVGLPQGGKTTLFNAMTGLDVDLGYAGTKKSMNRAVAKIPDPRLKRLSALFNPKKEVHATANYLDIGGLKSDKNQGAFSGEFLTSIKGCEALLLVVRAFENAEMPHADGPPNPQADIQLASDEFLLSDLDVCEGRIERLKKQLMKLKDKELAFELQVLEKCHACLEDEKPLRSIEFDSYETRVLRAYAFLSLKPLLIVLNTAEDLAASTAMADEIQEALGSTGVAVCQLCARIEMELAQMDDEDRELFLEEYGISEPAMDKVLRESYALLGLQTFFTVGEDECRAWTIRAGSTAPIAAGAIHSDIQKGFIRAEVVACEELLKEGTMHACKEKGTLRLEGKEYLVLEGDVVHFRFNV